MYRISRAWHVVAAIALAVGIIGIWGGSAAAAWMPTKPVEFNVPAGTGGGADLMARFISPLFQKNKITTVPWKVVNRSGGAGAEAFLYMKGKTGEENMVMITLDNLFTTPLATGIPFSYRDLTPIARLGLDWFILWVNAESPYKTAKEYLDAVKKQPSKVITVMLDQAFGTKFAYIPFKGGGEVCVEMVGKHVDSTVNNPSECVSHWKAGKVRPLAVIDNQRIPLPEWDKIPTLKEATGVDMSYLMLRGIFAAPKISKDVQQGYVELFKKVTEKGDWKKYLADFALKPAFLTGDDYVKWLEEKEKTTKDLMVKGGLLK
jgi:tripartite-type tricarboxylate transporter receptor subunit TctC